MSSRPSLAIFAAESGDFAARAVLRLVQAKVPRSAKCVAARAGSIATRGRLGVLSYTLQNLIGECHAYLAETANYPRPNADNKLCRWSSLARSIQHKYSRISQRRCRRHYGSTGVGILKVGRPEAKAERREQPALTLEERRFIVSATKTAATQNGAYRTGRYTAGARAERRAARALLRQLRELTGAGD